MGNIKKIYLRNGQDNSDKMTETENVEFKPIPLDFLHEKLLKLFENIIK